MGLSGSAHFDQQGAGAQMLTRAVYIAGGVAVVEVQHGVTLA